MPRPIGTGGDVLTATQLISRFDRNGTRDIGIELLRQVRRSLGRRLRAQGARGPLVWRLTRTPAGMLLTAFWHPDRTSRILSARPVQRERQERRRQAELMGIPNRRRLWPRGEVRSLAR